LPTPNEKKLEQVKEIVEEIKQDFVKLHQSDPHLKEYTDCLFVVGSLTGTNYNLTLLNDLDLRAIYQKIDDKVINKAKQFLIDCQEKYRDELIIETSDRIGIVRQDIRDQPSLLLHSIYYDRENYQNLAKIIAYTYQSNFQHLYGSKITQIRKIDSLPVQDVLDCPEGIRSSIEMLKEKKISYLTWEKDNNGQWTTQPKEDQIEAKHKVFEMIYHCVIYNLMNFLSARGLSFQSKQQAIEKFEDNYQLEDFELVRTLLVRMKQYRTGKIAKNELNIEKLRLRGIKFLERLAQIARSISSR